MSYLFRNSKNFCLQFRLNQSNLKILGLQNDANISEKSIKSAYVKLAKIHHPDVSRDKNSSEKFQTIAQAYSQLISELKNPAEHNSTNSPRTNQNRATKNSHAESSQQKRYRQYHRDSSQNYYDYYYQQHYQNRETERKYQEAYQKYSEQFYQKKRMENASLGPFLFQLLVSGFVFYTFIMTQPHLQTRQKNFEERRTLHKVRHFMEERNARLAGVPKLSLENCQNLTASQILEIERKKIARVPDVLILKIIDEEFN